ncbi:hypothetical protein Misp01_66950 [Microtetraspora sp. NBRC 13810]|nr:hypothetical protein Misp01_66950 [Microtetraspora sp. NBRC 13810]
MYADGDWVEGRFMAYLPLADVPDSTQNADHPNPDKGGKYPYHYLLPAQRPLPGTNP